MSALIAWRPSDGKTSFESVSYVSEQSQGWSGRRKDERKRKNVGFCLRFSRLQTRSTYIGEEGFCIFHWTFVFHGAATGSPFCIAGL